MVPDCYALLFGLEGNRAGSKPVAGKHHREVFELFRSRLIADLSCHLLDAAHARGWASSCAQSRERHAPQPLLGQAGDARQGPFGELRVQRHVSCLPSSSGGEEERASAVVLGLHRAPLLQQAVNVFVLEDHTTTPQGVPPLRGGDRRGHLLHYRLDTLGEPEIPLSDVAAKEARFPTTDQAC